MLIKRVSKSGGSLVVPLPKNYLQAADLSRGDYCVVKVNTKKQIVISKITQDIIEKGGENG